MDFYEVLAKRRTIRDFTDREVTDDILQKILSAAYKAPTNDHLHQLEFVVVRGLENIMQIIAPVTENTQNIQQAGLEAGRATMDADECEMFVDALPKQQKMLAESNCLVLPFYRQLGCPLLQPGEQSGLNYFASAWAAMENIFLAAAAEGLACAFRIPIHNESAHVKALVGAPADYELTCFLAIGYPAPDAFIPAQKVIDVKDRIHSGKW